MRYFSCMCWLVLVTLPTAWGQMVTLDSMYGSLQTPNFPEPYPNKAALQWNMTVPEGYRVLLSFTHFSLEPSWGCEYDSLKVEAQGQLLGVFCGDTEQTPPQAPREPLASPRNNLLLSFHSDFSNEERYSGFMAHYRAEDEDECDVKEEDRPCDHFCHNFLGGFYCSCRYGYLLHDDKHTCQVQCDQVYTERSGVLTSPDHPGPYPHSTHCAHRIAPGNGFNVTLTFDPAFDVEDHPDVACPYDHVVVHAGPQVVGPFCGSTSPGQIQTNSSLVTIHFHSDASGENLGWRVTYTSTGASCPVPQPSANGQIDPNQSEFFYRDHALVTCQPGYRLLKDGDYIDHYQLDCQADGTWSSTVPPCQVVDCGTPKAVAMGDVVFGSHANSTLFGSTIHYSCKEDVQPPHPNLTYVCSEKAEWTHTELGTELPSCGPACGEPSVSMPTHQKRVVGGRGAGPGMFPWQALLSVEDSSRAPTARWLGSGALLSEAWVLTAAHLLLCRRRDHTVLPVAPQDIQVFLGFHDARERHLATRRTALRLVLHPDFQPRNYDNDVALVRLSEGVAFSALVRPVCLPAVQSTDDILQVPPPNTLGVVAGWGVSNASGPPSPLLRYVLVPVAPQEVCHARYNLTANMFCAGFARGGGDSCQGDSGGALVMRDGPRQRWAVLGLVSWAGPEQCGSPGVYGVYARVACYLGWVHSHLLPPPS